MAVKSIKRMSMNKIHKRNDRTEEEKCMKENKIAKDRKLRNVKYKELFFRLVAVVLVGIISSAGTYHFLSKNSTSVDRQFVSNESTYGTIVESNENELALINLKNDYDKNKTELTKKFESISSLIDKLGNENELTSEEQKSFREELVQEIIHVNESLTSFVSVMDERIKMLDSTGIKDKTEFKMFVENYDKFVAEYKSFLRSNQEILSNINLDITDINSNVTNLESTQNSLKINVNKMQCALDSLDVSIKTMKQSIDVVERTVSTMQSDISNIQSNMSVAALGNIMYPVGSIYISANDVEPSTIFGGKWKKIEDRFLLASGSSYASGSVGGASTRTLTTSQLPAHNHIIPPLTGSTSINGGHTHSITNDNTDFTVGYAGGSGISGIPGEVSGWGSYGNADWFIIHCYAQYNGDHSHNLTTNQSNTGMSGGNEAFGIMPPYLTVNMWQRETLG